MTNRTQKRKKKTAEYLQTIHKQEKEIKCQINDSLWIIHSAYVWTCDWRKPVISIPYFFALNEHAQYRLLFSWVTEAFHKGFPIYHSKKKIRIKKKNEDNDPSGVWVHMFKVTLLYKPTENWPPKWLIKGFCKTWTEQHGLWLGKEFRVVIENIYLATAKHPNTC